MVDMTTSDGICTLDTSIKRCSADNCVDCEIYKAYKKFERKHPGVRL